jgi:hypothetical protein
MKSKFYATNGRLRTAREMGRNLAQIVRIPHRCGLRIPFVALEGIFLAISILSYSKGNIRVLLSLYLLSFLPFILALHFGSMGRLSVRSIFLTGLIFRLTLLASFPVFSDDVFRCLWEGKVQLNGINPYLVAPEDPPAIPYRDSYFARINHKAIPAIYPPISQLFFHGSVTLFYNLYFFKAMLILLEMTTLLFLSLIFRKRGIPQNPLLIWAWHPLAIVEIAGSGHQDIIGIFFLVGCLCLRHYHRILESALMLIGSFLSKIFPVILFPLLLRGRSKKPYLYLIGLTVLCYLPFTSGGLPFTGLSTYTRTWEANSSLFYLLEWGVNDIQAAKLAGVQLFLILYLCIYSTVPDFERASFMALGSFLIIAPTLHPWYLLWILPFLVLRPNRAWLYLTMAAPAFYHVLIDFFEKDLWQELLWIKIFVFIPFFVFLVASETRRERIFNA